MTFEVGIGTSQEWEPKKAAENAINQALSKLSKNPTFVLLFSTIHYKKNKGFQKILDTIYAKITKETPLIGGTISSFISKEGVFSKGLAVLAISYENMDVAVGYGTHTKRNPKKAAETCASSIRKKIEKSSYQNKAIINLISAPIIPKLPFFGKMHNVNSNILGNFFTYFGLRIAAYFGTGLANENEIIDEMKKILPEFAFIGGSSVDSGDMLSNFQFINDKVLTNAVVAIGISTDRKINLTESKKYEKMDKRFEITKSTYKNKIILSINNKPAKNYFLGKIIGLQQSTFYDAGNFYYKTADFFPITFEEDENSIIGIGGFLGENILLSHRPGGKKARLLNINGKAILKNIENITANNTKGEFGLFFSSTIFTFILGRKANQIKNTIDKAFQEKPYLVICPMVENICTQLTKPSVRVYSINLLSVE